MDVAALMRRAMIHGAAAGKSATKQSRPEAGNETMAKSWARERAHLSDPWRGSCSLVPICGGCIPAVLRATCDQASIAGGRLAAHALVAEAIAEFATFTQMKPEEI